MSSSHTLLSRDPIDAHYLSIDSYQPNAVTIADHCYTHSLLITPTQIFTWPVTALADLTAESLQPIIDLKPDLVLLGTGETFELVRAEQLQPLYAAGIAIECMNNYAACRTHMVLLAEKRRVVTALILLS